MRATLNIYKLGAQGDGLADYDGESVYVDCALPGEKVEAVLERGKDKVLRGRIIHVLEASADRQDPPCGHYADCGGCALQHMQQTAYRDWKIKSFQALLAQKKIHPVHWDDPVFIPQATRRRASFALRKSGKRLSIGFHRRHSHQIVDVQSCLVMDADLMHVRDAMASHLLVMMKDGASGDLFLQKTAAGFDAVLTAPLSSANGQPDYNVLDAAGAMAREGLVARFGWRARETDAPEMLVEAQKPFVMMGDLRVELPPLAFLQPSVAGQDALCAAAADYLKGLAVESPLSRAADLFAGCGTFTGLMRGFATRVDAFEGDRAAVEALKKSGHAHAFARNLFKQPLQAAELKNYQFVLLDPPRAGAKSQCEAMAASAEMPNIIYISCNPASFMRDAQTLIEGGYTLERLRLIDQFIWSAHVELAALFCLPRG